MENEHQSIIKIISIINVFYIVLSRILLIELVSLIGSELEYLYITFGGISIDIHKSLLVLGILHIVSSVALLIFIYIPFKNRKFERYLWLIFGIFLLVQPAFLTAIGVVLIFYSRQIKSSDEGPINQKEGIQI